MLTNSCLLHFSEYSIPICVLLVYETYIYIYIYIYTFIYIYIYHLAFVVIIGSFKVMTNQFAILELVAIGV